MIVKMKEIVRSHRNETYNKQRSTAKYITRDIFLNPEHVQMIRANGDMMRSLREGFIVDSNQDTLHATGFSTISLTSSATDIVVVGTVEEVRDMLMSGRRLLNG